MLTRNIWIEVVLIRRALGEVVGIIYSPSSKPPDLPLYVVVQVDNYTGTPWNQADPKMVPITPVSLGSIRQVPIRMAWAMTIHKSQGLTLQKAMIDIGKIERQGLTFTTLSRVKGLNGLHLQPTFTFERLRKMHNHSYTILHKNEEARLQTMSL